MKSEHAKSKAFFVSVQPSLTSTLPSLHKIARDLQEHQLIITIQREIMTSANNQSTSAAAVANNTDAASQQLQGVDIAKVLRSEGPVVSAVVLRCGDAHKKEADVKASSESNTTTGADDDNHGSNKKQLFEHLVEQIQLDTTPKKNEVEKLLGGPFTFVGQYEDEGIMLMCRRGYNFDATENDNGDDEGEKEIASSTNLNPHPLQPPFNSTKVYGDILCLKVAEVDDPLDNNEKDADGKAAASPTAAVEVASNDEFFLNYSKEEYLKFAARTDVVAPVLPEGAEAAHEEAGEEDVEDNEEGEWSGEEDDEDDDEDGSPEEAMMQLVLSTVLKQFQEQNGRAPDEEELTVLKLTVAAKLGMALPGMGDDEQADDDESEEENEEVAEGEEGSVDADQVGSPVASATTSASSSPADSVEEEKKRAFGEAGSRSEQLPAKKLKLNDDSNNDAKNEAGLALQ